MGLGVSVFLLAAGAILSSAVKRSVSVDLNTVGIILMAAGALGVVLFLSLFYRNRYIVRDHIVEQPPVERCHDEGL